MYFALSLSPPLSPLSRMLSKLVPFTVNSSESRDTLLAVGRGTRETRVASSLCGLSLNLLRTNFAAIRGTPAGNVEREPGIAVAPPLLPTYPSTRPPDRLPPVSATPPEPVLASSASSLPIFPYNLLRGCLLFVLFRFRNPPPPLLPTTAIHRRPLSRFRALFESPLPSSSLSFAV